MQKQGFSRWSWLIVFLLGGLLMLYGGAQDVTSSFSPELAPVPSWHPAPPVVVLVCGLIVLASALSDVVWGWQLRCAEGAQERRLAGRIAFASGAGMVADWISGYYGFGSLIALLTAIWLMR
jgi:hypothetical protein